MDNKPDRSTAEKMGSKQKILKAAEEIFGDKGFDGARVDEIAAKAGVNKALIYYYFDGKEKILEELIRLNMEDALEIKASYLQGINSISDIDFEEAYGLLPEFLREKRLFLKIMGMEALKNHPKDASIFSFLDPILSYSLQKMEELGVKFEDAVYIQMIAFFFGMLPLCSFYALGEKWAEYYHVDEEEAERRFMEAYKEMYVVPLMGKLVKDV